LALSFRFTAHSQLKIWDYVKGDFLFPVFFSGGGEIGGDVDLIEEEAIFN